MLMNVKELKKTIKFCAEIILFENFRRSLSPIAIRPSPLGSIKRKFDLTDSEPPAKRTGGLLIQQSR